MGANSWLNFCNDAGIVHPSQRGCTVQDLQVRQGSAGEVWLGAWGSGPLGHKGLGRRLGLGPQSVTSQP